MVVSPESKAFCKTSSGALKPRHLRGLLLIRWTACAAWVGNDQPTDLKLAEHLQCAFDCGKSPASSSMIAASVHGYSPQPINPHQ